MVYQMVLPLFHLEDLVCIALHLQRSRIKNRRSLVMASVMTTRSGRHRYGEFCFVRHDDETQFVNGRGGSDLEDKNTKKLYVSTCIMP
mmetsp:Transcript_985/g.1279  ORF Transcript_985/g.1279 Transcript_985/m.1279 type:complete len:88 (-) Transcript_985:319-582(-)